MLFKPLNRVRVVRVSRINKRSKNGFYVRLIVFVLCAVCVMLWDKKENRFRFSLFLNSFQCILSVWLHFDISFWIDLNNIYHVWWRVLILFNLFYHKILCSPMNNFISNRTNKSFIFHKKTYTMRYPIRYKIFRYCWAFCWFCVNVNPFHF